eukprot:360202-Chlamydomonas_euryale.AAC.13
MGVTSLWAALEDVGAVSTLRADTAPSQALSIAAHVDGKTIAVDLSIWLHQVCCCACVNAWAALRLGTAAWRPARMCLERKDGFMFDEDVCMSAAVYLLSVPVQLPLYSCLTPGMSPAIQYCKASNQLNGVHAARQRV